MPEMIAMLGNAPRPAGSRPLAALPPLMSDLSPQAKEAIRQIMLAPDPVALESIVNTMRSDARLTNEWPKIVVFIENRREALAQPFYTKPAFLVGAAVVGIIGWHFYDKHRGGSGLFGLGASDPVMRREITARSRGRLTRDDLYDRPLKLEKDEIAAEKWIREAEAKLRAKGGLKGLRSSPGGGIGELDPDEITYLGLMFAAGLPENDGSVPAKYQPVFRKLNAVAPSWLTGTGHSWADVARRLGKSR